MEDLLASLYNLFEDDAELCRILLECIESFELEILEKWFMSLKKHAFRSCNSVPTSAELFKSKFVIVSGSLVEGCLLSRYFGQYCDLLEAYTDKIEMEFDVMFPIGAVTSEQLIPCDQLGFFKLRGLIDVKSAIPAIFHPMAVGLEFFLKYLLSSHYNERGYFSIITLQNILANQTPALVDNKYLFGVLGIADHVPRFLTTPNKHGPAVCWRVELDERKVAMKSTSVDGVFCLKLNCWPDLANEWRSRNRVSLFPKQRTVEEIVSEGCLLVAKNPDLNHSQERCDAELDAHWRLSFSLAEIRLSKARSGKQNYCFFVCYVHR